VSTAERPIVAIDWGTTSLRAALLDAQGRAVEQHSAPRGILHVAPGDFPAVFHDVTAPWANLPDPLYLLCGMVGSRQGWMEAPYCPCPAGFGEIARSLAWIEPDRIAIVPGLSCEQDGVPDVMRGEETQVFGACGLLGIDDGLFVLPGTHSKWVRVERGRITGFSTFMTGEAYSLLRRQSILARTLPEADSPFDEAAFLRGLSYARATANLLRSAFSVRTLALLSRVEAPALESYLSGLVLGEELRSAAPAAGGGPLVVIASKELQARYALSLRSMGLQCHSVGEEAAWCGLHAIAKAVQQQP